jgi:hypothetical protein
VALSSAAALIELEDIMLSEVRQILHVLSHVGELKKRRGHYKRVILRRREERLYLISACYMHVFKYHIETH